MNASEENLLDDLLSAASEELEKLNKNVLQETDIFKNESNLCKKDLLPNLPSNIHNGDTDSSEDEGRRNFENVKYSDYGKDIKHLLEHKSASSSGYDKHKSSSWKTKALFAPAKEPTQITSQKTATIEKFKSDVNAFKQLWKTAVGTVVGVLNPNVLDKKDGSKDEATLSIDNSQKVMIFGQSKDFGTCKSTKKNGENCTAIVNINKCEYCVYHIRQEYQKCSKRSELQANFAGRGLTALRNKVLGKNEVFYAGKSYTAIPAKKNKKMEQKDNNRLMGLSKGGITVISGSTVKAKNKNTSVKKQNAARLDVSKAQRLRDMELLKKLGGTNGTELKNSFSGAHCTQATLEASKNNAINIINRPKEKQDRPSLSKNNYVLDDGLIIEEVDKTIFRGKLSATITSDESEAISLSIKVLHSVPMYKMEKVKLTPVIKMCYSRIKTQPQQLRKK
ncbi:hypothetical protein NQ318_017009 [Aromia moschata]|uniref:Protein MCM10 homolog n=1 Tax=Aromia moschata TaxID=1265417 RepID=A0AAV8XWH0_9CUCU|nr:hypothetical protein NQ318_017009 [Aromia moschata]